MVVIVGLVTVNDDKNTCLGEWWIYRFCRNGCYGGIVANSDSLKRTPDRNTSSESNATNRIKIRFMVTVTPLQ